MIRIGTLTVDPDLPPQVVEGLLRMYGSAGYLLDVIVPMRIGERCGGLPIRRVLASVDNRCEQRAPTCA